MTKKNELIRHKPIEPELIAAGNGPTSHLHMAGGSIPIDNPDCPSVFANMVFFRDLIGTGVTELFFTQPSSKGVNVGGGQGLSPNHCIARVSIPAVLIPKMIEALERLQNR